MLDLTSRNFDLSAEIDNLGPLNRSDDPHGIIGPVKKGAVTGSIVESVKSASTFGIVVPVGSDDLGPDL
jgi:hypothetical protein